jgi:demethylmenaquinone methyltransferase/2-methoxy-6-polyprenyl-1,4-benzoquinol methylase
MSPSDLDKSAASIRSMFEGVAPRYDFLNHLLSASLDRRWRRHAELELDPPTAAAESARVLDLCCGTGDQALSLGRRGQNVTAADFCVPMLALAQGKAERSNGRGPSLLAADTLALPFRSARFAAVTMSFGARNLADLDRGLREAAQVLRSGGKVVILEFAVPRLPVLRQVYLVYLRRILPWIGKLISPRGSAYAYLRDSVLEFPQRDDFTARLQAAGFKNTRWRDLSFGTVCLYTGQKA